MRLSKRKRDSQATKRMKEWPWQVSPNPATKTPVDIYYSKKWLSKQPEFSTRSYWNHSLDKFTMSAAIKASESVVSVVSYSDEEEIFKGTGTIIEDDGTILTSAKVITCSTRKNKVAEKIKVIVYLLDGKSYEAQVLVHDFHYGIAFVKIKYDVPQFKPACLRPVDDCVSLELPVHVDKEFQLCAHAYNLVPGDKLVAIGRYFTKPYDLMAAPGEFSVKRSGGNLERKGIFRSTCLITTTGVGGPIINQNGEVIGVVPRRCNGFTPFVPINIALKLWKPNAKSGILPPRPLIGMKMANLYTAGLQILEKLIRKYPDNFAGVIVEEVIQGSSADIAGLCTDDLIVECCGKTVQSFLELFDMMWDKTGESVVLKVIRLSEDKPLLLSMKVDEAAS